MKVVHLTSPSQCAKCGCTLVAGAHAIQRPLPAPGGFYGRTDRPFVSGVIEHDCVVCALRAIHEPVEYEVPDPNWNATPVLEPELKFIREFAEACTVAFRDGESLSLVGSRLSAPAEEYLRRFLPTIELPTIKPSPRGDRG